MPKFRPNTKNAGKRKNHDRIFSLSSKPNKTSNAASSAPRSTDGKRQNGEIRKDMKRKRVNNNEERPHADAKKRRIENSDKMDQHLNRGDGTDAITSTPRRDAIVSSSAAKTQTKKQRQKDAKRLLKEQKASSQNIPQVQEHKKTEHQGHTPAHPAPLPNDASVAAQEAKKQKRREKSQRRKERKRHIKQQMAEQSNTANQGDDSVPSIATPKAPHVGKSKLTKEQKDKKKERRRLLKEQKASGQELPPRLPKRPQTPPREHQQQYPHKKQQHQRVKSTPLTRQESELMHYNSHNSRFTPSYVSSDTFHSYQSTVQKMYRAAGVLPYRYNKVDRCLELLLGKEKRRNASQSTWCEFGGKREPQDTSIFDTVAREFSEETCGVLSGNVTTPSQSSLAESIKRMHRRMSSCFPRDSNHYRRAQFHTFSSEHSLDEIALHVYVPFGKYVMFVLPFHDDPLPATQAFEECVRINNSPEYNNSITEAQKHTYKWFTLRELITHLEEKSRFLYPFFAQMLQQVKFDLINLETFMRQRNG